MLIDKIKTYCENYEGILTSCYLENRMLSSKFKKNEFFAKSTEVTINQNNFEEIARVQPPRRANNSKWDEMYSVFNLYDELKSASLQRECPIELAITSDANPKGLILYGPPRCGKKFLVEEIVKKTGSNFINITDFDLVTSDDEQPAWSIKSLFEAARKSQPCLILFDCIQLVFFEQYNRDDGRIEYRSERCTQMLNQLLNEIDEIKDWEKIYLVHTTTLDLDMIDPALLKPGRFNRMIYIDFPLADRRYEMLKQLIKVEYLQLKIDPEVDLNVIAHDNRCDGFNESDLSILLQRVDFLAREEYRDIPHDQKSIKYCHFDHVLSTTIPYYREYYKRTHYENIKKMFYFLNK